MKTPSWEPSPGALVAWLLANKEAVPADLYTIALTNGTVLRYTSAQARISVNGNSYEVGPGLERTSTKQSVGISVDSMSIEIFDANAGNKVNGIGIIASIALGHWDGALVLVERVFFDAALVVKGVVPVFEGTVGPVKTGRGQATLEIRSSAELLDIKIPGNLYQPACRNTLYDAYCGVNMGRYTVAGSVAGGLVGANNAFTAGALVGVPAYFDMGVLTFTSGPNAGVARTIKQATAVAGGVAFSFVSPFPSPIAVGHAFSVAQGCNKTMSRCIGQFNNLARFRGEPFIPAPETVV